MGDGPVIYSASDIGGCVRAQAAARLHYPKKPFDDATLTLFKEGHMHERAVVDEMVEAGWEVEWETEEKPCLSHWETCRQIEVVLKLTPRIWVVAHLDGVVATGECWCMKGPDPAEMHLIPDCPRHDSGLGHKVLEVKSMSKDVWEQVKADGWDAKQWMPKYKWQVSVQMLATGYPAWLRAKNRNNGQVFDLLVEEPFYDKMQVLQRVLEVESAVRTGTLPDCTPGASSYFCPFDVCSGVKAIEEIEDEEVEKLAREYKVAKLEADAAGKVSGEAKRRADEVRTRLRKACGGVDGEILEKKLRVGKVRVTWYKAGNSKGSLDTLKLDALGLAVEDVTSKGSGERLKVEVDE